MTGAKHSALDKIIAAAVTAAGYEYVGTEKLIQGPYSVLRVYIDNPKGVTIGDCEKASRQVAAALDVEDPMSGRFRLELSSPGLNRPLFTLEHFQRFIGHEVRIRLRVPEEGRRNFQGILQDVVDEHVLLEVEGEIYKFGMNAIDKANLVAAAKRPGVVVDLKKDLGKLRGNDDE